MTSHNKNERSVFSLLFCSLMSGAVYADDTTLGSFGETELQKAMGNGVQTVCGGFVQNGDASTEQQKDLFSRCGEMVHSANELAENGGATAKSLGVSGSELAAILQQIAGEEVIAQGNIATDTMSGQNAMVSSRISTLMQRTARVQYNDPNGTDTYASKRQILGMGASGDEVGLSENFSIFANISGGRGSKDATDREDAFDLDASSFIVGADYRINNSTVLGASIGWDTYDADYDINQRVTGGKMEADTTTTSIYALYNNNNYYVSGILGFGNSEFDTSRRVNYASNNPDTAQGADRNISSNTDSKQTSFSATLGYQMLNGATSINPYLKLSYLDVEIDAFAEQDSLANGGLGLQYEDQNIKSTKGILGVQVSWVVNQDFGVINPYVIAEWQNEFETDSNSVVAQYISDPRNNQIIFNSDEADSSFFNFSAGASLVLPNSLQLFIDVSSLVGMDDFDYNSLTLGIRKAF
jgi:outer membrane lipase/esterase